MPDFVIHALQVGEGILALSPLPGRGGDYDADLEHLREWQPAMLITLTTEVEMVEKGVRHLGQDIQDRGARWVHLPIRDFGIPDAEVEEKWPEVSRIARKALSGGGRVLIHCMGGCGRSGMTALRLMVEAGEDPQAALTRLRRVRPCAVENDAQMKWAVTPTPSG
ncbi:Dual specificity phosphatase, catalytic domain [Thalassovita litoralis]|uniref:Dual specificity phosphatase, catalytic domain n=1 Tax=Thalassovita litoralis TaxID=1010611 RepID=A0A521DFM3_9RHOB|nr:dual specificity protein phosphatase family protein [Thalassovita litoralis]SMO70385.1 Dual specificity phosphatase, catalytic domain [Thalassovita litoralis]